MFGTVEQVALDAVPAGRAGQRAANAANADGWILRGGGDVPGLFSRRDHRHENGLRAEVEYLLDDDGIARGHPDHGRRRVPGYCMKLGDNRFQPVGRVFHVDEHPVQS